MMQGKTLVLILVSVVFSVVGQLFLKSGADRLSGLSSNEFLPAALRDLHVVAGLLAWIASTLSWLYVLRVAPLSRSYGLTSLTYLLVLIASVAFFGEHVRRVHVLGTILIVIGITCLLAGD